MKNDQIFTPDYITEKMLDLLDYDGENIKTKTIIEPSFGDGAFLTAIVRRVLDYAKTNHLSENEICNILDNIHGIEIDKKYYDITIEKLNNMIEHIGIQYNWKNLVCENALLYQNPINFDLCVANPPYIRIHDLDQTTRLEIEKNYDFSVGNTDLYVIFFELCFNMMKKSGKLCFITPNSYFKNSSQKTLRKYLIDSNIVESIIDYGNVKVFGNIATYAAITLFDFEKNDSKIKYTLMETETKENYQVSVELQSLTGKSWTFASNEDTDFLNKIAKRKTKLKDLCDIQYGLATNADKIYLVESKDMNRFEKHILRPVVKASKLESSKYIIFPYEYNEKSNKFEIIDEEKMKTEYPKTYDYLESNKDVLQNRDMEKGALWYQYARSQGLQNSNNHKLVIQHMVSKNAKTCNVSQYDENTLVYSGIYIILKDIVNQNKIKNILTSEEFCRYVKLMGKDMSGGYKSFNTKIIKEFGIEEA